MTQSIGGVLIGIALVPGSIWLLSWNEGRSVQTARSLTEGAGQVISAEAGRVASENEGKLIHLAGDLATSDKLVDSVFGLTADGIVLRRKVEMYQWQEKSESRTREKVGGGTETVTTYTYSRAWSDRVADSSRFKQPGGHENPGQMRYTARQVVAANVSLGAFKVPESLVTRVGTAKAIDVDEALIAKFATAAGVAASLVDGKIFIGNSAGLPRIGDLRVSFEVVPKQTVSIVARQAANSLEPFQTKAGGRIHMISAGNVAADQMFKEAKDANVLLTWLIRAGGVVLMFVAFSMILGPIRMLGAVLPILSELFALGTGLIALLLTLIVAPVTIAIAWFAVRPVLAAIVLGAGLAIAAGIYFLRRKRPAPAATHDRPVRGER